MSNNDLWGGVRIPIIMVSGPVNSGKTLFGLTIDPNCRKPAAEQQPTTIDWDQEGSADSYVGALNFEHKDTRAAVAAGVHMKVLAAEPTDPRWVSIIKRQADCNDSPPASMFRAWYLSLLDVPPGKYLVGMTDTFTPLQEGMIDWLRRHPEAFGRTINEYTKASSMFLWPDVKSMLSHILATDCRTRFETFVINVHLKNEWKGGAKTGRQIAEGLDVLEKLATLHIELDRTPKEKGKDAPRVPSGLVRKERLVRFGPTADEDQPILPPRLEKATPQAIREYVANPPDFTKLKPGERVPDQSMSEDERLRMQAGIAENQRASEESKIAQLELARLAAHRGRIQTQPAAEPAAIAPATATANPATANPAASTLATPAQKSEMMGLLKELFATGAEAKAWLAQKEIDPGCMTGDDAVGVISDLLKMKAEQQLAQTATVAPNEQEMDGRATQAQRDEIKRLTVACYGSAAVEQQKAWLASIGVGAVVGVSSAEAQQRITQLDILLTQQNAQTGGDDLPF